MPFVIDKLCTRVTYKNPQNCWRSCNSAGVTGLGQGDTLSHTTGPFTHLVIDMSGQAFEIALGGKPRQLSERILPSQRGRHGGVTGPRHTTAAAHTASPRAHLARRCRSGLRRCPPGPGGRWTGEGRGRKCG